MENDKKKNPHDIREDTHIKMGELLDEIKSWQGKDRHENIAYTELENAWLRLGYAIMKKSLAKGGGEGRID